MKKVVRRSGDHKVIAQDPPILTREEWMLSNLLGVLLIVMAVAQLASFGEFRDILQSLGVSAPTAWGVGVIMSELLGAAGFFKLRLSYLFRATSASLALLASGFWFLVVSQAVSSGRESQRSSGLFGSFLNQSPGWWTVIEVSALLLLTVYAVALTRYSLLSKRR